MQKRNNIFKFATGELSQDAMICWLIDWFNYDNPRLKEMSRNILSNFIADVPLHNEIKDIVQVDVHKQFSRKASFSEGERDDEIKEIKVKVDVLVILNNTCAVIIEDKTYTGEHDQQLQRYKEGLKKLSEKPLLIGEKEYELADVITVFWKTGFHYDVDRLVEINRKADKVYDTEHILQMLDEYKKEEPLLEDYILQLGELKSWYDEHGRYWNIDSPKNGKLNVVNHHYAQVKLMRDIFPEEKWLNGEKGPFKDNRSFFVKIGTNQSGYPWTEMNVCDGAYEDGYRYYIFWRIDHDTKMRPYLRLNFWEGGGEYYLDKESGIKPKWKKYDNYASDKKTRHKNVATYLVERIVDTLRIDNVVYSANEAPTGDRSILLNSNIETNSRGETPLFQIIFDEKVRENWGELMDLYRERMCLFTDRFIELFNSTIKEEIKNKK
ncbi:MAG: PD-(D/E)XK nuclease family protein [Lachnospiraceae bacterium]|nr:PD-(D/E)XK nuclease family protein [Lachnospiraceae bacterium]